jgi:integrase
VGYIKQHIKNHGTAPDGRLVRGAEVGRVPEAAYGRAWRSARKAVLSASQVASLLGKRPYDLRHAAVSTWLNAGVQPTIVAEWAGHSVQVLLRVYAKCIDGQDALGRRLIEDALGTPEPPKDDPQDNDQDQDDGQPET